MKPKISIAMATYNGAKYIGAQLQSIAEQTMQPDELVITDDGSCDATLEIIRRFAATVPFAVTWSQNYQKLGYGGNFNAALLKTTGNLIFLSDQDDVWFPDKIRRMFLLAEAKKEALLLMNDAALTDADLNETGLTKLGQIHSAGFKEHRFVMGCCAAIRRELLDLCLPIPAAYPAHDDWIVGIADGLGCKHVTTDVLQYYRRHGNNESQGIINQTTRVTRWHVLISDFRHYINQTSMESVNTNNVESISSQQLLLRWTRTTITHTSEPLANQVKCYHDKLKRKVIALDRRGSIKKLRFLQRLIAALCLWRTGGYQEFSGFQTAVRDILLP